MRVDLGEQEDRGESFYLHDDVTDSLVGPVIIIGLCDGARIWPDHERSIDNKMVLIQEKIGDGLKTGNLTPDQSRMYLTTLKGIRTDAEALRGKTIGRKTPMMDATFHMTVPPEKWKEILQTFKAIMGSIRSEQGCMGCNCYVDVEADRTILFKNEWTTKETLQDHLRSVNFSVLIGAMKLLDKEPNIRFNTITSTVGREAITAARCRRQAPATSHR